MLSQGVGGELNELQAELTSTALRQTQAMRGLIEKSILVTNLETGSLKFDLRPTELPAVVKAAIKALAAEIRNAGVEIDIDLAPQLPLVMADGPLLSAALQQVIENAIRYGQGAPIHLAAWQYDTGVLLTVRDQGPGIPEADVPMLFRSLQRDPHTLNTAPRGLGLGLTITRELIERQGGTITVQSEVGAGSLFSLFLPGVSHARSV